MSMSAAVRVLLHSTFGQAIRVSIRQVASVDIVSWLLLVRTVCTAFSVTVNAVKI